MWFLILSKTSCQVLTKPILTLTLRTIKPSKAAKWWKVYFPQEKPLLSDYYSSGWFLMHVTIRMPTNRGGSHIQGHQTHSKSTRKSSFLKHSSSEPKCTNTAWLHPHLVHYSSFLLRRHTWRPQNSVLTHPNSTHSTSFASSRLEDKTTHPICSTSSITTRFFNPNCCNPTFDHHRMRFWFSWQTCCQVLTYSVSQSWHFT